MAKAVANILSPEKKLKRKASLAYLNLKTNRTFMRQGGFFC